MLKRSELVRMALFALTLLVALVSAFSMADAILAVVHELTS